MHQNEFEAILEHTGLNYKCIYHFKKEEALVECGIQDLSPQCLWDDIADPHSVSLSTLSPSTSSPGRAGSVCGAKNVAGI